MTQKNGWRSGTLPRFSVSVGGGSVVSSEVTIKAPKVILAPKWIPVFCGTLHNIWNTHHPLFCTGKNSLCWHLSHLELLGLLWKPARRRVTDWPGHHPVAIRSYCNSVTIIFIWVTVSQLCIEPDGHLFIIRRTLFTVCLALWWGLRCVTCVF